MEPTPRTEPRLLKVSRSHGPPGPQRYLPLPQGCGLGRTEHLVSEVTGWGWRLGEDLKRRDTGVYNRNEVPSSPHIRGVGSSQIHGGSHTTASPLLRPENRDSDRLSTHCVPKENKEIKGRDSRKALPVPSLHGRGSWHSGHYVGWLRAEFQAL